MQRTSSICCMKAIGHFGSESPTSYILNVKFVYYLFQIYCFPHSGVERMISVLSSNVEVIWSKFEICFIVSSPIVMILQESIRSVIGLVLETLEEDLEETKIRTENCVFLLLITFCNNSVTMFIFRTRPPPISQLTSTISLLSPPHHLTTSPHSGVNPSPSSRPPPPPDLHSPALLYENKILPCLK